MFFKNDDYGRVSVWLCASKFQIDHTNKVLDCKKLTKCFIAAIISA